jgi:hypothetical protein
MPRTVTAKFRLAIGGSREWPVPPFVVICIRSNMLSSLREDLQHEPAGPAANANPYKQIIVADPR